jgi:hypothetical protein
MTLVEALISLAIAIGVVASAVEASRLAIARTAVARLDAEAALSAEAALARVGNDIPLSPGHYEGNQEEGRHWAIDVSSFGDHGDAVQSYVVSVKVTIARAGIAAQSSIGTLRLVGPR